jgi:hypothetical protein
LCYLVLPSHLDFSQTMTNRSLIIGKLLLISQCMIENALLHSILVHNFQANKITMASSSRWQSIWPIIQTNRNQEMGNNKNWKTQKKIVAIPSRWAWVPQHEQNKILQPLVNRQMIGLPLKPQKMWDSWRRQHSNPWWENIVYSIILCNTHSNMNYQNVAIIYNELNIDWNKMDSIVIMA